MPNLNQYYFIEGKLWASQALSPTLSPKGYYSEAFFCPKCGEVWARLPIYEEEKLLPWSVNTASCEACNYLPSMYPGSLLRGTDYEFRDRLPKELYLREIELAVKCFLTERGL